MKFEEQFIGLIKTKKSITLWNSGEYTFDKYIGREDDTAFCVREIKITCLDKQRVKDVLNGELLIEIKYPETKYNYGLRLIEVIKKELGLEE